MTNYLNDLRTDGNAAVYDMLNMFVLYERAGQFSNLHQRLHQRDRLRSGGL